jgi:hypothetical protein
MEIHVRDADEFVRIIGDVAPVIINNVVHVDKAVEEVGPKSRRVIMTATALVAGQDCEFLLRMVRDCGIDRDDAATDDGSDDLHNQSNTLSMLNVKLVPGVLVR